MTLLEAMRMLREDAERIGMNYLARVYAVQAIIISRRPTAGVTLPSRPFSSV